MATNLEFIKEVKIRDANNPEITDIFSDRYDIYKLYATKTYLNGSGYVNAWFNMRVINATTGSPDTTSNYDSAGYMLYSHTTYGENKYASQDKIVNSFAYMSKAETNNSGEVTIYNPYDSSSFTHFAGQGCSWFYQIGSGGYVVPTKSTGVHKVEQSNSGLQILITDIEQMDIQVYGVKK